MHAHAHVPVPVHVHVHVVHVAQCIAQCIVLSSPQVYVGLLLAYLLFEYLLTYYLTTDYLTTYSLTYLRALLFRRPCWIP